MLILLYGYPVPSDNLIVGRVAQKFGIAGSFVALFPAPGLPFQPVRIFVAHPHPWNRNPSNCSPSQALQRIRLLNLC